MKENKRIKIIKEININQEKKLNNALKQLSVIEKKRLIIPKLEKQANDILEKINQNPKDYEVLIKSFKEVYTKLKEIDKKYNYLNILAIKQNIVEYEIGNDGKKHMDDYIDQDKCDHDYWIYLGSYENRIDTGRYGDEENIYHVQVRDENDKGFVANHYGCLECGKEKHVKDYQEFEKTHMVLKRNDQESYFEFGSDYFDDYKLLEKYKEIYLGFLYEYPSSLAFLKTKYEFLKEEYEDRINILNNKRLKSIMKKEYLKKKKEKSEKALKQIQQKINECDDEFANLSTSLEQIKTVNFQKNKSYKKSK